jgi:hypothetical protein
MKYYYANAQNQATGPVELHELENLLKTGVISLSTNIVEEGQTEWKPVSAIIHNFGASSPKTEMPPAVAATPASRPELSQPAQKQYFYANSQNQPTGPINLEELERLHQAGVISSSTNVFEDGLTEWKPASSILSRIAVPPSTAQAQRVAAVAVHASRTGSEVATAQAPVKHEKGAFVVGVIALCFSAIAAAWSFVGGACCGWGGWGWAGVGLIMAIVSLCLNKSKIGWWALALAIFAFVWVFVSVFMLAGALGAFGASLNHPK